MNDLLSKPRLMARCPQCNSAFRLRQAKLFDSTKPLPPHAKAHLDGENSRLEEEREALAQSRKHAREAPRRTAEAVRIGKVVEKIAPSLRGFPFASRDCRALFEPIDYVAFKGLEAHGIVDALVFIDVKSGGAVLQPRQRAIKDAVVNRRVGFQILE